MTFQSPHPPATSHTLDAAPPSPPSPPPQARAIAAPSKPDLSKFGIVHFSVYVPRLAVSQADLEVFDNASSGKYTIGLGQSFMSFVSDREDVISIALTAVSSLLRETGVNPNDIGRLDVGTETVLDKSKSIKTSLMRLFTAAGNTEIEGLDATNACYGGTAALFNALAWAESSAWDGRLAIVVASDIAVYAPGPARPTGGAGAVAMLLGPYAPMRFEPALRATVMGDTYDFFKPSVSSEYPAVRGAATVDTYVHAMDACYKRFMTRAGVRDGRPFDVVRGADFAVFHAPFYRMVRKAFARLVCNDYMDGTDGMDEDVRAKLQRFRDIPRETSHTHKEAVRAFVDASTSDFERMCAPGAWLAREIGNCYTASVYTSLAALVSDMGNELIGKRVLIYSFGSGFAASMFSVRVTHSPVGMVGGEGLHQRLAERKIVSAEFYDRIMREREKNHGRLAFQPSSDVSELAPGTWYLREVDEEGERFYDQVPYR